MPLNHEEAAATVKVTGVSLGCINPDMNRWEVAFIRHPSHSLMMEVVKESNGQSETIRPKSPVPVRCTITVEATNDANPAARIADEAAGTDEDFNQIVDIERKIYEAPVTFKRRPEFEVTPLFVPRAVLYAVANKLTDFPVRLVRIDDEDRNPVDVFGPVSTTAGADITCGERGGEVTVRVEGEGGFVLKLPNAESTRYVINFDNTCPPAKASAPGGEGADAVAEGGAAEVKESEESSAEGARPLRKITSSGEVLVENHSDFVLCYAFIEPPEGADEFDLVDDDPERGDGAVCINTHLGISNSIQFPS